MTERTKQPASFYIRDATSLGRFLRERRVSQGLTLAQFYEASNLTTRFVSELERGKIAYVDRLLKVLQMLGLEMVIVPRGQVERVNALLSDANE